MLNSSVINNLSAGAEKIKNILVENGDDSEEADDVHSHLYNNNNNHLSCPENNNESTDLSSLECSYVDAHLLEEKLKMLNVYTDKLISVNSRLTRDIDELLNEKLTCQTRVDELMKEKEKLESELKNAKRTVDLLQEELNDKHLQLSALKTRLDGTSCLDINQLKSSISDLKRLLTVEQEKSEHLISKVDGLQLAVEEKNNRISQLINELHQTEAEKATLEIEVQELMKDKKFLIDEKIKLEQKLEDMAMDREMDAEEARVRLQDSAKANDMIPQLMQLVIQDKNDEIKELSSQLKEIKEKILLVQPFSHDSSNPVSMLDELINNYLSLRSKADLNSRLNVKSPVPMFTHYQSLPLSPRSLCDESMVFSATKSFGSNSSKSQRAVVDQHNSYNELENQLCELQLKCDKMYFAMNNLREENEILKLELENLREEKDIHSDLPTAENNNNGIDILDKDSDFIDEEDSVEDALLKIHKQSAELLVLSETRKHSQEAVIPAIIDVLPIILLSENNESFNRQKDDHDVNGGKCNGLNYYNLFDEFTSEKMESFLDKFSSKKLGIQLLDKMFEMAKFYSEACEKIKSYVTQNKTISGQLSSVEEALIKAQAKLDVYQKKYDKVKRKLKDLSNEIISTQASNLNLNNNNNIPQPTINSINKVKVDHCNHGELYHQYRRCLSHRNSLIYQKKYLLNVLGGYKLTERATLALLANLNVTTEEAPTPISGRIRFKSTAIAVIAIHRINHIRLRHSSYPKKNDPYLASSLTSSKVTVPSTSPIDLPSHPSSTELMAKDEITSRSIQTNATIKAFVTRLQRLHRTLGLHYEAKYNSLDS